MADLFDTYGIKDAPKVVGAAMAPIPSAQAGGQSWGDVGLSALQNAPSSAANFAHDLVQPILHPFDTAQNIYALGKGVGALESPKQMVQVTLPNGQTVYQPQQAPESAQAFAQREETAAPARAVGEFFADRYGSVDGIKKTLATDPVGALSDAATVLTGGGGLAIRAPGMAGKFGQIAGRIGAAIDPLTQAGNVVKGTGTLAEKLAANTLGMSTGAGAESIRQAGRAGLEGNRTFLDHMRGNAPMTDVADMARDAVEAMRKERSAAYKSGMADVSKDRAILDFAPIDEAIGKANEVGTFNNVVLNRSAGDTTAKMFQLVDEWKKYDPATFHTPEGLDALKRAIGDVRDSTEHGTPSRVAADKVYSALKQQIEAQAPGYAKTMADYAKASDELKEISKTFSLKEGTATDTTLRKLQSVMRNNVQTNYGERLKLAEVLAQHEPNLPPALAGQALNSITPRGLVARGGAMAGGGAALHLLDPTLLATLPLTSPRLMGEAAYGVGALKRNAGGLAGVLGVNAPNVRSAGQAIFQTGRADDEIDTRTLARALMRANERRTAR
jgi:hypothetical protein